MIQNMRCCSPVFTGRIAAFFIMCAAGKHRPTIGSANLLLHEKADKNSACYTEENIWIIA